MNTVRALSFGVGLLVVVHVAWLLSLAAESFVTPLAVLLWVSPAVAAFLAAWLAERRRVVVGIMMALPATFAALATNAAAEWRGGPATSREPTAHSRLEPFRSFGARRLLWSGALQPRRSLGAFVALDLSLGWRRLGDASRDAARIATVKLPTTRTDRRLVPIQAPAFVHGVETSSRS